MQQAPHYPLDERKRINPKTRRKFKLITTDSNHSKPIYTNLINRQFDATLPNERWVSDITFRPTIEVWLYPAVIIDLFSRKIIGWSMSHRMKESLVIEALKMVLLRRKVSSKLLL